MLLKSLELQGFKTFPSKTKLSFEEGVTSVVGPNGSGKSNISDAMRWVLGEQSVRTLRCGKMEDVIFSGTPQRKAQGYAEVTLNIENSDRRLNFDNDMVAITRRYYRSGESEYLINKSTVRLKDINELFMDTGLGRDGYSIIGQGKIDSIVGAKSEDRREIFEEASGISRFRYRKAEAERRLTRTEENLVRLRDIFAELEERVEPLRIQAEKAEKFIAYDGEKKGLEISLWVETLNRSGGILREHNEKIDIARGQQEAINIEIDEIAESTERNAYEMNELTALADKQRAEASGLDEQAVRTEGEISVKMNDISYNGRDIERLKKQIEDASTGGKDIDAEIEQKKLDITAKEAEINDNLKRLSDFTEKLETLRKGSDESTKQIELSAAKSAEINSALARAQIIKSSAESSRAEIEKRDGTVEESIKRSELKLEAFNNELQELDVMLSDTERYIVSGENAVKGYELRLQSRRQKVEAAKAEADRLTLDANEQKRRAKLLQDLERNLEGFAVSVKAVMKESSHGVLKGIYGPVTQIIKTPKDYAVALEIALGAAMQNIVVETEKDAKAAIGFLKQRNIGRATFLPRTTIKGSTVDVSEVEEMPGFVGIASKLCQCDERFSGIRDSLLGRVVIAEDLDSAVSIAKKGRYRFRVVSLDGQVVNAGGSLTGGSKAKNSGLLSRGSEIERVSKNAAALEEKAVAALAEHKAKQEELSLIEAELDAAKGELQTHSEEKIKILSQCDRVKHDIENGRGELESLLAEQENAAKRLKELEDIQVAASKEIEQLELRLEEANRETETLAADREDLLTRCDDISATIQEIRMGEFSLQKELEVLENAVAELEQRKLNSSDTVERLREEIVALEAVSQRLNEEVEELKALSLDYRSKAEAMRLEVQNSSEKRTALEQKASEYRKTERELISKREAIGQEYARLQERSDNLQKEYDNIISKLWDEYELTRREAEEQSTAIEDVQKAQRRLTELKNLIKGLGSVNVGAVVEYEEVSGRYEFLKTQIGDVEKSKAELAKLIGELTKQMRDQFVERFAIINNNFGSIFKELFGGGKAELSFTNEEDILTSGIDIRVQPPGKIVTPIESLSGGEKALVAISIYFAIMRVNPPPFCMLDEIEAALDDVNVNRFAQYLRRMSDNTQFIVITHRRGTMEAADTLYGVTMQDEGVSKLLVLKNQDEAEQMNAIS